MCHCTIACALITVKQIQQRKIGTNITGKRSRRGFVSGLSLCDVTCESPPLQLLQVYSTVFIIADETVEGFVSCCSFTWINVKKHELVIIEMDRFAFQQAEVSLSASTVRCSLLRLSRTAWTEFYIIGNFVSLWLYCNFKFVIGPMMKLKSPTWFPPHSFHANFIVSSGTALYNVKSNCRKVAVPAVCMCIQCWCSCMYVYAWIYEPTSFYIKFSILLSFFFRL